MFSNLQTVLLQVKSLSRFRSLYKPQRNLFSNLNFIKMHHDHQGVHTEKVHLLLTYRNKMYSSVNHYDSSSPLTCYDQTVEINFPFKSPDFPSLIHSLDSKFRSYGQDVFVRGSCNGLICIETPRTVTKTFCGCFDCNLISLMNPSTNEYKEIPEPPCRYADEYDDYDLDPNICTLALDDGFREEVTGFGYDCKNEDYKFLRVESPCAYRNCESDEIIRFGCKVNVYTLGSNSWKLIPFMFPYSIVNNDGVFVNGSLHWIATQWNRGIKVTGTVIVSFDFEDERFIDVSPLEHFDDELDITLGNLGGCLCIFGDRYPDCIEVWVMKDCGVRESWIKQFTIARKSLGRWSSYYLKPIRSFKNGEILLSIRSPTNYLNECALVLYDPEHECVRTLKIHNGDWNFSSTYVESLVSLNTGTYLDQRTLGKTKEEEQQQRQEEG